MLNPLDAFHHGNEQRNRIGQTVVELFIIDLCPNLKDGKPAHPAPEHAGRAVRDAWNLRPVLVTAPLNPGRLCPCHPTVTWTVSLPSDRLECAEGIQANHSISLR